MHRYALAGLIGLAFVPPATQAAPREATVSTPHGSAKAEVVSYCTSTRTGSLCADGTAENAPALIVTPNDTVTIAIDDDVKELSASLYRTGFDIKPVRLDARTYTFSYPQSVLLPQLLLVFVRYEGAKESGDRTWAVQLRAPDTPTLSAARLKGRRLSIKLACPSTCDGTLTLRTNKRIARFTLEGVTTQTLTTTLTPAMRRFLKRNPYIGARLATRGRATINETFRLR